MRFPAKIYFWLITCSLLLSLISCDQFESSLYEVSDTGYSDLNAKSIAQITPGGKDTFKIAVIGDTQRFYGESEDVVDRINEHPDIDFVVHTGDIVDFGVKREYVWMHETLKELNKPYVAVIGNHDLIGTGDRLYENMYGESDFSFMYGQTKFVFINTNSREFDMAENVPDINWLDKQLADTSNYDQAIVVFHVPSDNTDFNPYLRESFDNTLDKYGKVLLTINGHNHNYGFSEAKDDDHAELNSFSTGKKSFVKVTVTPQNVSVESH